MSYHYTINKTTQKQLKNIYRMIGNNSKKKKSKSKFYKIAFILNSKNINFI